MIHTEKITEQSAWKPVDLKQDGSWQFRFSEAEITDLENALTTVERQNLPLEEIDQANFPLPQMQQTLHQIREQLRDGFGFVLAHGFPTEGYDQSQIAKMYWGLCSHLGLGLTQNSDGSLLHYVTEGHLRPNQGTRGVGNPGKVNLHVDLADCTTLLCVRQPASSPQSHLASTTTIHNHILESTPELLDRLYEGFIWDRQNEHGESETATSAYRVPVFSQRDGVVSCRYNRNWMRKAADRSGGFSDEDTELLDTFDAAADANRFAFDFGPGDIQFVNNYTVLHGRQPHPPAASEAETRLLLRIWFNIDGIRPLADESIIRHGVLRHGKLGWTAKDVAAGLDNKIHPRRTEDMAPLVA